jgi:hypothetical protein
MIQKPDVSGFRMVDLCLVVEWSGFRMAKTRWPKIASLDRFGTKIFYEHLLIKRSRLVFTIPKPDKFIRFFNGLDAILFF